MEHNGKSKTTGTCASVNVYCVSRFKNKEAHGRVSTVPHVQLQQSQLVNRQLHNMCSITVILRAIITFIHVTSQIQYFDHNMEVGSRWVGVSISETTDLSRDYKEWHETQKPSSKWSFCAWKSLIDEWGKRWMATPVWADKGYSNSNNHSFQQF